eukprot:CAMPEP_0174309886 /NCGR_PEP_ID=MMETSP0810-20121108/2700_1 /TAXON_ID=73025 ORGANISM="Eutreptiella gymnastica-like, Strain CCMP1594" /NCGR_SAMPLE_ID=MMETSP0810 /ASSEMBLY_ACC=CAM_ASM_000659 /LENGTH=325 /DNA_ID=CAMNT_0015417651 /DNA_START=528 /DNA_END=1500 /DNA_ORIENTATION=-
MTPVVRHRRVVLGHHAEIRGEAQHRRWWQPLLLRAPDTRGNPNGVARLTQRLADLRALFGRIAADELPRVRVVQRALQDRGGVLVEGHVQQLVPAAGPHHVPRLPTPRVRDGGAVEALGVRGRLQAPEQVRACEARGQGVHAVRGGRASRALRDLVLPVPLLRLPVQPEGVLEGRAGLLEVDPELVEVRVDRVVGLVGVEEHVAVHAALHAAPVRCQGADAVVVALQGATFKAIAVEGAAVDGALAQVDVVPRSARALEDPGPAGAGAGQQRSGCPRLRGVPGVQSVASRIPGVDAHVVQLRDLGRVDELRVAPGRAVEAPAVLV